MNTPFKMLGVLALFGAARLLAADVAPAPLIPVEKFFSNPAIASVQISPDGSHAAFFAPINNRVGIALMDLATGKVEPLVSDRTQNIKTFLWKGNENVVYSADVGGNESYAVQNINLKSRKITGLLESFADNTAYMEGQIGRVLDYWVANPKKILVIGSRDKNSWFPGIYEVDISTGKRSEAGGYTNDKRERGDPFFDNTGRIRIQFLDTEKQVEVRARLGDEMKFTTLMTFPRDLYLATLGEDEIKKTKATFLADNQTLVFVDYSKHDRGAVVAWDMVAGKEKAELFVPPEGEVTELIFGRDRTKLIGVQYEGDKEHTAWLDPEFAKIQAALDRTFPETINHIVDWSDDRKKFIVQATSDVESAVNFIFDLSREQPKLMALGSARPELPAKELAHMEPVHFKARDGLELQGYLTRPKGAKGPGPFILNPHGGPYGIRDNWGYNGEVQFLANRGYTVLQVNYRGSGGFGRKFLEAGRLEWGKKMQDDLTDATKWAIEQGYADPKHLGIFGASYGGYAALAAATFTPDLFRCSVNYVGVADLTYLGRRDQGGDRIANEFFYAKWIHPDMEELKRRSPVNYVENIKIPMMHAYGENDPRVEWRQWKKLRAELDKHHIVYEVFNQGDEGHGFSNVSARVGFYLKLEDFLNRNMFSPGDVRMEPVKVIEMPAKQ